MELMNYLSHYFYNRELDPQKRRHDFHVGVAIPDILSAYSRRVKVDWPLVEELKKQQGAGQEFFLGVDNHEEADRVFHTGELFKDQCDRLKGALKKAGFKGMRVRSWFLAHILFEIILDAKIMALEPDLTEQFYHHFQEVSASAVSEWTQRCAPDCRADFEDSFQFFRERQFLYEYKRIDGLAEAINRVAKRARQHSFEGDNRRRLRAVIESAYEELTVPAKLSDFA